MLILVAASLFGLLLLTGMVASSVYQRPFFQYVGSMARILSCLLWKRIRPMPVRASPICSHWVKWFEVVHLLSGKITVPADCTLYRHGKRSRHPSLVWRCSSPIAVQNSLLAESIEPTGYGFSKRRGLCKLERLSVIALLAPESAWASMLHGPLS